MKPIQTLLNGSSFQRYYFIMGNYAENGSIPLCRFVKAGEKIDKFLVSFKPVYFFKLSEQSL